MIILARETISKRKNLPVELQCGIHNITEKEYIWCVQYAGGGHYSNNFEEVSEYIKTRKFATPKQLEKIEGIKKYLLKTADYELEKLKHIEDIKNTPEYRGVKTLLEIREQVKNDLHIPPGLNTDTLIMLYYLKDISESLSQIMQDNQYK